MRQALDQSADVGAKPGAYAHKPKIPKLQMTQDRCMRMIGKCHRTTNVDFLYEDFSILKVVGYY
jgi:hypothetical protein